MGIETVDRLLAEMRKRVLIVLDHEIGKQDFYEILYNMLVEDYEVHVMVLIQSTELVEMISRIFNEQDIPNARLIVHNTDILPDGEEFPTGDCQQPLVNEFGQPGPGISLEQVLYTLEPGCVLYPNGSDGVPDYVQGAYNNYAAVSHPDYTPTLEN